MKKWSSKSKWLLGLGVATLVGWYLYRSFVPQQSAPEYTEIPVQRGSIAATILSTGEVKPENRVEIKPPIPGRAEKILVREGDRVKKGSTLVIMSSNERAALLDAARVRGPEELAKWEDLYRPTPILAPVDGTLIQRQIETGQTFTTNDAILVMSDRLIVEAQVDETDLARVKVGQSAQVTLDAYPDQPIRTRVESIAYEATTVNNVTTYIVKLAPSETPSFMRSGMTSNVRFEIAAVENVLLVDSVAINVLQGEFHVLKRDRSNGQAISVPIKIGLSDGKRTEIKEGVIEGETLLLPIVQEQSSAPSTGTNPFAPRMPSRQRSGSRSSAPAHP